MEGTTTDDRALAKRVWISAVSVTDFDPAIRFYRDILGFPVQLEAREFDWMEIGPDEPLAKIGLSHVKKKSEEKTPTGLVLEVEDMAAFAARLKAHGVRFTTEPTKQPWGGIVADFLDPDGNEIQAVEHSDHYMRP